MNNTHNKTYNIKVKPPHPFYALITMTNADGNGFTEHKQVGSLLYSVDGCLSFDFIGGADEANLLNKVEVNLKSRGFTDVAFVERDQIRLPDVFPEFHQSTLDASQDL